MNILNDCLSKYAGAKLMVTTTAALVITFLKCVTTRFGISLFRTESTTSQAQAESTAQIWR